MKQYYIIGIYKGKSQDLDAYTSLVDATKALVEYRLAYGKNWTIDIVLK